MASDIDHGDAQSSYTFASPTTDGILTPRSITGTEALTSKEQSEVVPWANKTYEIRHRPSRKLITLVDGKILLQYPNNAKGGRYWKCTESFGWFGFRNQVSGTYITRTSLHGHQCTWAAQSFEHNASGYFCAKKHPEGGYLLLVRDHRPNRSDQLVQLSVCPKAEWLMDGQEGKGLWEFVEV